jgi:hypothetical protein
MPHHLLEWPNPTNGSIFALAFVPLHKQRYVNHKLERELIQFRKEVEGKHAKAETARYRFPRQSEKGVAGNGRPQAADHMKIKEFLR